MRDRRFRHAGKRNLTALLTVLIGAAFVLTAVAAPATAASTDPTTGQGISIAIPLITETGGVVVAALLVLAFVLYDRRRPGSRR